MNRNLLAPLLLLPLGACGSDDTIWTGFSGFIIVLVLILIVFKALKKK